MDMYTLLYLKWITNKELLYSAWDSAQCYAAACMGGEFGGEWIHVYVWLSPFAVHLKLLLLLSHFSRVRLCATPYPIQNKMLKKNKNSYLKHLSKIQVLKYK